MNENIKKYNPKYILADREYDTEPIKKCINEERGALERSPMIYIFLAPRIILTASDIALSSRDAIVSLRFSISALIMSLMASESSENLSV